MALLANLWRRVWDGILDNRNKLTATGGFLLGIIATLGLKDFYPELEHSFRQRLKQLRATGVQSVLPREPDIVRLEDHTRHKSVSIGGDGFPRWIARKDGSAGLESLIGDTPLIRIKHLSEATGCEIWAKAEFLNGAGQSPKDRVALSIIDVAEEEGLLKPGRGDTVYEGTSGSTGISLAAVCRARGYRAHMYVKEDSTMFILALNLLI